MTSQTQRLRAVVRGHVQGVGFRWFVMWQAKRLGLTGWARNGADGRSVDVLAEGERAGLEELLRELRQGIPPSRVDVVEATWGEATGEFDGFARSMR